jgi:hypothetical protein
MNFIYGLRELYLQNKFNFRHRDRLTGNNLILVYTMGKVGLMSIDASLRSLNNRSKYLAISHTLRNDSLDKVRSLRRQKGEHLANHLRNSILNQSLISSKKKKNWKIITCIRESVSRNVSAYFHDIKRYHPNFINRFDQGELPIETIEKVFLTSFMHDTPLM